MSHFTLGSSGRRNDRFSWISLPTSDISTFDRTGRDIETARAHESLRSPVSRVQSQDNGYNVSSAPSSASTQTEGEIDGLLHPKPTESHHPTTSSAADLSSMKDTPEPLAADKIDQCTRSLLNMSIRLISHLIVR
jgi:hypothetical protein